MDPAAGALDRPVWASLAGRQALLAEGGPLAKRYRRDVNVFASAYDDSAPALTALAELVAAGERVYVLQASHVVVPPGLRAVLRAPCVQMLAACAVHPEAGDTPIARLGDADAADMVSLARLTEPGPFLERTHVMGRFIGIRVDGRLVAMAGERMRVPGYTELSGVCTHPDFRGRGFARRLSAIVAAGIQARGETPFLHAWKDHRGAIALYESLGFRVRADVHVAVLERATSPMDAA